jgi:hypothetical protein
LRAKDDAQLFAAAYLGSFRPAQPENGYLGDAGRCTNSPGAGRRLRFAFRVPARQRFLVEVEQCSSTGSAPRYAIAVRQRAISDSRQRR